MPGKPKSKSVVILILRHLPDTKERLLSISFAAHDAMEFSYCSPHILSLEAELEFKSATFGYRRCRGYSCTCHVIRTVALDADAVLLTEHTER
jgi:hypothetical protein